MPDQLIYAIEVFFNGLMAGVLYALVALGFVLIYKASGIFNYAQGVMALFAAMTLVGVMEGQVPFAHLINAVLGTKVHHYKSFSLLVYTILHGNLDFSTKGISSMIKIRLILKN